MTKLQFFKDTLNKFLELKKRNDTYDDMSNKILSNEITKDFPVYLSDNFCFPYETLVIDCLSEMWDNPKEVKDNIEYLIYECMGTKNNGLIQTLGEHKKTYIIKDIDSLCEYLLDFYKILGE